MTLSIHNLLATAAAILAHSDGPVAIRGKAVGRKTDRPFQLTVSPDPRKGSDGLGIALILNAMDETRRDAIDAVTDTVGKPDIGDDTPYAEASRLQSEYRSERAEVRKQASTAYDSTDAGKTRLALIAKYRDCKRATFRVPGTDMHANLSAVIGKVTGGKVASAFAKSLKG